MAKLSLKKESIEAFASNATQKAAMVHRRVSQKKNKIIESVPLLNKMKEKVSAFDQKMSDRFHNYKKVRNLVVGAAKFYVAGQIGGPALVALGAINAVKAIKPLIKTAEEKRQSGEVSGLLDYMKKNPKETIKHLAMASLGAAVVGCGLSGQSTGKLVARTGVAAMVVAPEMKELISTTKKWAKGDASFKNVAGAFVTVGITAGSFVFGTEMGHSGADAHHIDASFDHGAASFSDSMDTAEYVGARHASPKPQGLQNTLSGKGQSQGLQKAILSQEQPSAAPQPTVARLAVQKKAAEKSK